MAWYDHENFKKWRQEFRKLPKPAKWIVLLVAACALGIWLWAKCATLNMQSRVSTLTEECRTKEQTIAGLRFDNNKLHEENLHWQALISPFQRKAQELYPQLDHDAALGQLSKNLNEIRALATRDVYKPLAGDLRTNIVNALKSIATTYTNPPPTLLISIEAGDRNRQQLAMELLEIVQASGLPVRFYSTSSSMWSGVPPPLIIRLRSADVSYAQRLFGTLRPMFNAEGAGQIDDSTPAGELHLNIVGTPDFYADGSVVFR